MEVGSRFCSSFFNGIATMFMLLRSGLIASVAGSYCDFQQGVADAFNVSAAFVQAAMLVTFILLCFFIKLFKLWRAFKQAKEDPSENIEAVKVKNLQTVIITSSDTLFKILTAIAILIGSSYSGAKEDGECAAEDPSSAVDQVQVPDSEFNTTSVVDLIFAASFFGFFGEVLDMLDEYLTMAFFFKKTVEETVEENTGVELNVGPEDKADVAENVQEKFKEKVESTQGTQKNCFMASNVGNN